jgi:two-component system nitrate/nitrite sensor histidine kinase NarQ
VLNACRHANAQTVSIRLVKSDPEILLIIEDDGIGFDMDAPRSTSDHFGITIMQARAARIGGKLQIETSSGKGTRIKLVWKPELNKTPKSINQSSKNSSTGLISNTEI